MDQATLDRLRAGPARIPPDDTAPVRITALPTGGRAVTSPRALRLPLEGPFQGRPFQECPRPLDGRDSRRAGPVA